MSSSQPGRRRRRSRASSVRSQRSQAGSGAGSPAKGSPAGRGVGGDRLTAKDRGRKTYKFPLTEEKKALRRELGTVGDGWGFYDLIHFKKQWTRIGMWEWESDAEKKRRELEERKEKHLEDTRISRAKGRFEATQQRQQELKKMRCQWTGFDHRGRRAVCLNNRVNHQKTHQPTKYCGFHGEVCVYKWPTGSACVPYLEEHRNGYGLCLNHYKSRFKGTEPEQLDKIPGVIAKRSFEEIWRKKLERAVRIPHPLAPEPPSSSSDYDSSDDSTDSEAEREVERARILARRKAIEKALREAQGLSSSEDEDEPKRASRSWDQLWYTKVKQPLIQRFRGRRAATQIQAQWRARKARRHLLTLQRIVLREERMKAAFVIQNVWRGHLGRVRMRNHRKACHRAARLIQKGWHRFLFFAAIRRTIAARKIAKWFHRQRIKKFLKMLGIIAKARLSRQRREREWKERLEGMRLAGERIRGAIGFQRCWRAFAVRKLHKLYVKVYTRVSNEIGFWYRGSLERTVQRARLRRAIHAATKMQSVVRCRQAKKYVAWLRIAYRNAATTLQRWWRGELDRELVRRMLVQNERNWRWLNANAPRDAFENALPRRRYGLPPLEAVDRLSKVRRGTYFQKMGPYIPLDEALWMQFLAEGVQYGPRVVDAHPGVLAPDETGAPVIQRLGVDAGPKVPNSDDPPAPRGQDSSAEPPSLPGNKSRGDAPPVTPVFRSRLDQVRFEARQAAGSGNQNTVGDTPAWKRPALPQGTASATQPSGTPRQAGYARRTKHAGSLVPTAEGLRDIMSPMSQRKKRYYDVAYQRTAPVFREVESAKQPSGIARLWNRPGVSPTAVARPRKLSSGARTAPAALQGIVPPSGLTVPEMVAWEDRLIEERSRQVLGGTPAPALPSDHRLRRPGVLTPATPSRHAPVVDDTQDAAARGRAIQREAKLRGDRIRARRARHRVLPEMTTLPTVAAPACGAGSQSIFASASLPSRVGPRQGTEDAGASTEQQPPAVMWFDRPSRGRRRSKNRTRRPPRDAVSPLRTAGQQETSFMGSYGQGKSTAFRPAPASDADAPEGGGVVAVTGAHFSIEAPPTPQMVRRLRDHAMPTS